MVTKLICSPMWYRCAKAAPFKVTARYDNCYLIVWHISVSVAVAISDVDGLDFESTSGSVICELVGSEEYDLKKYTHSSFKPPIPLELWCLFILVYNLYHTNITSQVVFILKAPLKKKFSYGLCTVMTSSSASRQKDLTVYTKAW